jgi:hypothetical protein
MKRLAAAFAIAALFAGTASIGSERDSGGERFAAAQRRWIALNASDYSYDLGIGIGAPFGYGEFHVKVKGEKCVARHYAGGGFGRPRFVDRFRYRACREGLLPTELFEQVTRELSNGRQLTELKTHPEYGFPLEVSTDTDQLVDASWGFQIKAFRLNGRAATAPNTSLERTREK